MSHRPVRILLVLLAIAAVGAAGYLAFLLEQRATALRNADRAFAEDVLRLQATLADFRAAQSGYLATGQDAAVWIQKAAQLRQQAEAQLRRITAAAPAADLDPDLSTVSEAVASLGRFDKQIAELLRQEETLTASALIFSDSAQVAGAASAALSRARGARASKTGAELAQARQQEVYALGGAAAVVVIVLLLLAPVPSRAPDDKLQGEDLQSFSRAASDAPLFAAPPEAAASQAGLGADFDLALERRAARVLDEDGRFDPPVASPLTAFRDSEMTAVSSQVAAPAPPVVDLPAAAQLCTDLARVRDTSELQGLLGRAAALLDASGIVVWMGGAGGDVVWPAFSHGYTPHTLSKMQALPRDGSTPVSVAFRTGAMEVVPAADSRTSGAIVAPILTSGGCVGVMAVEIRHGAEMSNAEQALAGIIAAQLATLVAGEQG